MCYVQASVDRYRDGEEILQKREWIYCPDCPLSGPEACRYQDVDKMLVYDMGRMYISSNVSDTSSRRGSSIGASSRSSVPRRNSSRREPPAFTGLLMDAFMGERRRIHRRSESRTRTSTITVDGPAPRVYPAPIPSPTYRSSYESTTRYSESPMSPRSPMTPGYSGSFEADIVDASPYKRGRPIIHNENPRSRRNESTEVNPDLSRARTPSPTRLDVRDIRAREERRAQEEARRQRRAELESREAQLEHDINKERRRQERRRQQGLRNAEINARIPRPSPVVRQPGILRRGSTARPERDSVIEELRDAERGEQVLRQAIAERKRREREERQVVADNERYAHEAAAEAERRRLARRFGRGSERVEYHDDPYRH